MQSGIFAVAIHALKNSSLLWTTSVDNLFDLSLSTDVVQREKPLNQGQMDVFWTTGQLILYSTKTYVLRL